MAQKVSNYLGYIWKKTCHQEFVKIAQSGHTAYVMEHENHFKFEPI